MVLKIFKSLFGDGTNKKASVNDVTEKIALLNNISNGLGEYAFIASNEDDQKIRNEKASEMLSIITDIERYSKKLNNSELLYSIAIAYRNYCAWFVRGDNRKQYLDKCISYLNDTIIIDSSNVDAKSELGRLLIEEKIIRNLPKGIEIIEGLKKDGNMPSYLNSILSKANRQSGNLNIDNGFNLCAFKDPSTSVFNEERKRFRALIRMYKKNNEIDQLKITLHQFYNLAVLVSICYGEHDCNSGVIGWQYDEATKIVEKVCDRIDFSFVNDGFLEKSNFISKNDWKTFVAVFGESTKSFNPATKFNTILQRNG